MEISQLAKRGRRSSRQSQSSEDSVSQSLFVREDLSKPENRANILLLVATSIAPFWDELHRELRLPRETVVRPEKNIKLGRPDFVARLHDTPIAHIEWQNWAENKKQSRAYAKGGSRVILILGTETPEDGTTWGRIQDLILRVQDVVEARQRVVLDLLRGAIDDILQQPRRSQIRSVEHAYIPEGWLKQAAKPLLELPAVQAGACLRRHAAGPSGSVAGGGKGSSGCKCRGHLGSK
jgi:hypothetical protein